MPPREEGSRHEQARPTLPARPGAIDTRRSSSPCSRNGRPRSATCVDTVRGAVDAHLNPQAETEPSPWTHRLPGMLALIAGAMWSARLRRVRGVAERRLDRGGAVPLSMFLMFLSLPGDYMAAHGRRIAGALGVIGLVHRRRQPSLFVAHSGGRHRRLPDRPWRDAHAGCHPGGDRTDRAVGSCWSWRSSCPRRSAFPVALGLGTISDDETWVLGLLLPYGLAWVLSACGWRSADRPRSSICQRARPSRRSVRHEPAIRRARSIRRAIALHPRVAVRRPEARLRDHDRRRGDLRQPDGTRDALRRARPTRAPRPDRGPRARGSAAAIPAHGLSGRPRFRRSSTASTGFVRTGLARLEGKAR